MYNQKFHTENLHAYRFLVTGGAGFIGSHLVEYLLKHDAGKVMVLDNLSTGSLENLRPFGDNPRLEFIKGDIRDLNLVKKLVGESDFILHQAALGSVPRSIRDPATTHEVNITGFLNMLIALKESPRTRRMVYAASSSTYGDSPHLPKTEEIIGKPLSPYAVTKYVNELYAGVFGKLYNTDTIGLRYFNVFGPRQNPNGPYAAVIPLFMLAVLKNQAPVVHGDGLQTRDFTFVENAVQANIKALFAGKNAANEVFNVAVGQNFSLLDLIRNLEKITGKKITPEHTNPRPGDVRNSLADIRKAREILGYEPVVKFEEGLRITWEFFKNTYEKSR